MPLKWLFTLIVLSVLLCSSCVQNNNPAGKIWFYTHSSGAREITNATLTPACFINLQNDGNYTRDSGHFDYGKWTYKNNQLALNSFSHKVFLLPVDYITATEMQVGLHSGPFDNFESQRSRFADPAENPFAKENNLWRIAPAAEETDQQLKNRMLDHLRFWELYFTWALNNNIQYIDVRSTPTPIMIYGNAVSLKPFAQLPDIWKSYFYNEEDCRKASDKIKYIFDSHAIAWPHTENKYKMFISVFQQMQQKLP